MRLPRHITLDMPVAHSSAANTAVSLEPRRFEMRSRPANSLNQQNCEARPSTKKPKSETELRTIIDALRQNECRSVVDVLVMGIGIMLVRVCYQVMMMRMGVDCVRFDRIRMFVQVMRIMSMLMLVVHSS
jgi:hypothetical protein